MHPYYRETFGYKPSDYPCSASIYPQLLTLPLYPDLTADEAVAALARVYDTQWSEEALKTWGMIRPADVGYKITPAGRELLKLKKKSGG